MNNIKTVSDIRSFNRFYVHILGLLNKGLHNSNYNLIEARTIYELYQIKKATATELVELLGIDKGYLSRILKKLVKKGLVVRRPSEKDKRYAYVGLTPFGCQEYAKLNKASDIQIEFFIRSLTKNEKRELMTHMNSIQKLLSKKKSE